MKTYKKNRVLTSGALPKNDSAEQANSTLLYMEILTQILAMSINL